MLDERTVLDMVRRHGARCSAVASIDEMGGEARVYVIDDHLVLKVQRPHRLRPRTSLAKETFFLHQLAACPDIVVSQVLGYGRHDSVEYIVMTRMPGVPVLTIECTGVQRLAMLHQLGRTLRRLHWQLDVSPADLASRVLAALPASVELVALHSNPGPVHTFCSRPLRESNIPSSLPSPASGEGAEEPVRQGKSSPA
jgi:aminoglycoside phosphotransferase